MKHQVIWVEATGSGDIFHSELFPSLEAAQEWLAVMEAPDDMGYLPEDTHFSHCGPRTIIPAG